MLSQLAVIYTEMGFYQQSNELLDFILTNINEKMTECYYFKANNYAHLGLFHEAYKAAETYLKETRTASSARKMRSSLIYWIWERKMRAIRSLIRTT